MTKLIVGLHGKRRVGKDTAADYLVREHGFTKISFADAIREECCEIWQTTMPYFMENDLKDKDSPLFSAASCRNAPWWKTKRLANDFLKYCEKMGYDIDTWRSPRWVLLHYSDFIKSKFGEDIWIQKLISKVALCETSVVIPDIRSDAEAHMVRLLPGFIGIIEIFRKVSGEHPNTHILDARISQHLVDDWLMNQTLVPIFQSCVGLSLEDLINRARLKGAI